MRASDAGPLGFCECRLTVTMSSDTARRVILGKVDPKDVKGKSLEQFQSAFLSPMPFYLLYRRKKNAINKKVIEILDAYSAGKSIDNVLVELEPNLWMILIMEASAIYFDKTETTNGHILCQVRIANDTLLSLRCLLARVSFKFSKLRRTLRKIQARMGCHKDDSHCLSVVVTGKGNQAELHYEFETVLALLKTILSNALENASKFFATAGIENKRHMQRAHRCKK